MSVHIRQVGDFTNALGARLGAQRGVTGSKLELADGGEKGGRRGDWIEVSPSMGQGMPQLRIDG